MLYSMLQNKLPDLDKLWEGKRASIMQVQSPDSSDYGRLLKDLIDKTFADFLRQKLETYRKNGGVKLPPENLAPVGRA